MPGLKTIILYLQQRFRPIPWLILPFVYLLFSIEDLGQFNIFKLVYALLFLLSYRLFDDLMCMSYDMKNSESRFYYQEIYKRDLVIFNSFFFLLLIGSIYFTFNDAVLFLHVGVTFIFFSFYRALKEKKWVLLISLLKYPVLIYSLGDGLNSSIYWALTIFIILLIKELMDEEFIKNINIIKNGTILIAIITKGILWSYV